MVSKLVGQAHTEQRKRSRSDKHIWGKGRGADRTSTYRAEEGNRIDERVNDTRQKRRAEKLPTYTVEIIPQSQTPQ